MRRFAVRALVALLTFSIGIGCGSVWMARRYAQAQQPEVATPRRSSIPSDTFITLERTGCYGICPTYTLAISADGTVIFSGSYAPAANGYHWKRSGVIKGHISQEQLGQLIAAFEKADYFSLQDSYRDAEDGCPSVWTDSSTAYTAIKINGREKSIEHYLGCADSDRGTVSYPRELTELEERIDEIVNTQQWMQ